VSESTDFVFKTFAVGHDQAGRLAADFRALDSSGETAQLWEKLRAEYAPLLAQLGWTLGTGQGEGAGADPHGDRPPTPGGTDAEPTGEQAPRDRFDKLPRARRLAYFAFLYVAQKTETPPDRLTDREAFDWLRENGIDEPDEIAGELADYCLPDRLDTFTGYCTQARRALGETKYSTRRDRPTGSSIVRADQI